MLNRIHCLLVALFLFSLSPTTEVQKKFTGTISFVSITNDIPGDSFQLVINKSFIEKINISKFSFPFNRIIFIKDSGRIYHINYSLGRILWQDIKDKPFDTSIYHETNIERVIMGYHCNLLTHSKKMTWYGDDFERKIYSERWVTQDFIPDYGQEFFPLLKSTFGIYEKGIELARKLIIESEKDTSISVTQVTKIASIEGTILWELPKNYDLMPYNRETIIRTIKEQGKKNNPFWNTLNQ